MKLHTMIRIADNYMFDYYSADTTSDATNIRTEVSTLNVDRLVASIGFGRTRTV